MNVERKTNIETLVNILLSENFEVIKQQSYYTIKYIILDKNYYIASINTNVLYDAISYGIYNSLDYYISKNLERFTRLIKCLNYYIQ